MGRGFVDVEVDVEVDVDDLIRRLHRAHTMQV